MLSRISKGKTKVAKILVVDDEPGEVMVVSMFLKHNGYEVITASDGLQCLAKAGSERPDLVLLDNKMPNMDGPTALVKLQASKNTEDIPVIMVTAFSDEKNIAIAQNSGAIEYVVKPFDYTVLLEKIAKALKSKNEKKIACDKS